MSGGRDSSGVCVGRYIRRSPGAGQLKGHVGEVSAKAPRNWKGLEMWMWAVIIVVVAAVVLVAKWMDRSRGSQGASRSLDLPGIKEGRPRHIDTGDGFNGM